MADFEFGTIFHVTEEFPLTDPNGRLYANLLPGLSYKITPRNRDAVMALAEEGKAAAGANPGTSKSTIKATKARVSGSVAVKPRKKAKE